MNEIQMILPSRKVKKAFCCSTLKINNLAILPFRPSGFPSAEKMTIDL